MDGYEPLGNFTLQLPSLPPLMPFSSMPTHLTPRFTLHTKTSQVRKYQELAAEDIRFDVPLADACYEDGQRFCASVPPVGVGGWRVWGMPRKGVAQGGVKLL